MLKKKEQKTHAEDGLIIVQCKCGKVGMLSETEVSEEDLSVFSCPECDPNVELTSWRHVCSECGHIYPYYEFSREAFKQRTTF